MAFALIAKRDLNVLNEHFELYLFHNKIKFLVSIIQLYRKIQKLYMAYKKLTLQFHRKMTLKKKGVREIDLERIKTTRNLLLINGFFIF